MRENVEMLLPLNLQFFAEDPKDDDTDDNKDDQNSGSKNDDNNNSSSGEKTFTQSQVSSMMAKEKNEGKKAILNALGFNSVEEVKKVLETKKEDDKPNDSNKELQDAKSKAEQRATMAENKLACVMAGVNKDSVDDVLSIALTKVTDEKNLTNVLEEMKNVAKYSGFFGATLEKDGTGSDVGHIKQKDQNESLAQRLAKQNAKSSKTSSYFR